MTRALLLLCATLAIALAPSAGLAACPPPCSISCWPNDCQGAAQNIQTDHTQGDQDIHNLVREYVREDVGGADSLQGWMKDDFIKIVVESFRMAAQQDMANLGTRLTYDATLADANVAKHRHMLETQAATTAMQTFTLDNQTGDSLLAMHATLVREVPHALERTQAQAAAASGAGIALATNPETARNPETAETMVEYLLANACNPAQNSSCTNTNPETMGGSHTPDLSIPEGQMLAASLAYAQVSTLCPDPMVPPSVREKDQVLYTQIMARHDECLSHVATIKASQDAIAALDTPTTFEDLSHMIAALEGAGFDNPAVVLNVRNGKVSLADYLRGLEMVYGSANTGVQFASLNEPQAMRLKIALKDFERLIKSLTAESVGRQKVLRAAILLEQHRASTSQLAGEIRAQNVGSGDKI